MLAFNDPRFFSFLSENRFALKCLLLTFNILLESKINISLCTKFFTDHLFIC